MANEPEIIPPPSVELDVRAEKAALNNLIEQNAAQSMDTIEKVEAQKTQVPEAPSVPPPVIEVPRMETPAMANQNVQQDNSVEMLNLEIEKLKRAINEGIVPMINNGFNSISDRLPKKDGDKILEQRITLSLDFAFNDRLSEVTTAPVWR